MIHLTLLETLLVGSLLILIIGRRIQKKMEFKRALAYEKKCDEIKARVFNY